MKYPYITENNLEYTQEYNYTAFCGKSFLHAYLQSRDEVMCDVGEYKLGQISHYVKEAQNDDMLLRLLIKTFEINKRLYGEYEWSISSLSNQKILKPNKNSPYDNIYDYIAFGIALGKAFEASSNLLYLNTLLKLNDTLISLYNAAYANLRGGGGANPTKLIKYHQVTHHTMS